MRIKKAAIGYGVVKDVGNSILGIPIASITSDILTIEDPRVRSRLSVKHMCPNVW
jgi:hypothetical protein